MSRPTRIVLGSVASAIGLGAALAWLWLPGCPEWLASWFIPWAQTPGFGGAAAVVAALVAYTAARQQRAQQLRFERKEQWWKRAEWALNATLDDDPDRRTVGFQMLTSLAESEYAAEHEVDVITAATDRSLDDTRDYVDQNSVLEDNGEHREEGGLNHD